MAAGGCDLDGAFRLVLPAYVGHVYGVRLGRDAGEFHGGCVREDGCVAPDVLHEFTEGACAEHVHPFHEGGLIRVSGGYDCRAHPPFAREADHGEDAVGVSQVAFQRQLSDEDRLAEHDVDLATAGEDADCDRAGRRTVLPCGCRRERGSP